MTLSMPESDLSFSTPDLSIMISAQELINAHIAASRLEFLPVMAEKLPRLRVKLSTASSVFRDELTSVLSQLNNTVLETLDTKQRVIDTDERLPAEKRQQATELLNKQRVRIVSVLTATVRNGARAIAQSVDDLSQISFELKDGRLQETLQRQIDVITQRDTELNIRLGDISADRRLLDDTLKIMEKNNLLDMFKEVLPTEEELAALMVPKADAALIKVGLDRLTKILDKISGALTYLDLTRERDRLRVQYNELLNESRNARQEIGKLANELRELTGMASLERNKAVWVQEARKVPESLYAFLDAHTSEELLSPAFAHTLSLLKTYITSFYSINRTV